MFDIMIILQLQFKKIDLRKFTSYNFLVTNVSELFLIKFMPNYNLY
jgi:hypothetical protein